MGYEAAAYFGSPIHQTSKIAATPVDKGSEKVGSPSDEPSGTISDPKFDVRSFDSVSPLPQTSENSSTNGAFIEMGINDAEDDSDKNSGIIEYNLDGYIRSYNLFCLR